MNPSIRPVAMLTLDPDGIGQVAVYRLMIDAVVPRPIALVSTTSPEGVGNLAPFSFYNAVSSHPPCLMFSIARGRGGVKKDTLRNIEATGQFVIHFTPEWLATQINQTSAEYPYGIDEMKKAGLTPLPAVKIKPARVKESPVHFECELYKTLEIGDATQGSTTLVVGKIVLVHVMESAYRNGRLLIEELKPLSRLGGQSYGLTSGIFELPRPKI